MHSSQSHEVTVKTLAEVMDPDDGGQMAFGTFQCGCCERWHWGSTKHNGKQPEHIEARGAFLSEADAATDCLIFVIEFVKTHDLIAQYFRPRQVA